MRRSCCIGYCCLMMVMNACVYAATAIHEKDSFYSIHGSTATELRAQMRKLGPLEDNHPYDAYTRYHVKWRFQLINDNGSCRLVNIRVTADVNYTYPEWEDYSSASSALQGNWDSYLAKLKNHERQHGKHGLFAAHEIDEMLVHLPAMSSCGALEKKANERAYEILGKYQQADVVYDSKTNHGISQGVVLQDE